jgi:hypothetical protein
VPENERVAVTTGRPRIVDFALTRLRQSRVLQVCAVLSFVDYGALIMLAAKRASAHAEQFVLPPWMALFLALMSIASWTFMFGWYPFLESLIGPGTTEGRSKSVGRILETLAIGCVAVVHAMLTIGIALVVTNHLRL